MLRAPHEACKCLKNPIFPPAAGFSTPPLSLSSLTPTPLTPTPPKPPTNDDPHPRTPQPTNTFHQNTHIPAPTGHTNTTHQNSRMHFFSPRTQFFVSRSLFSCGSLLSTSPRPPEIRPDFPSRTPEENLAEFPVAGERSTGETRKKKVTSKRKIECGDRKSVV